MKRGRKLKLSFKGRQLCLLLNLPRFPMVLKARLTWDLNKWLILKVIKLYFACGLLESSRKAKLFVEKMQQALKMVSCTACPVLPTFVRCTKKWALFISNLKTTTLSKNSSKILLAPKTILSRDLLAETLRKRHSSRRFDFWDLPFGMIKTLHTWLMLRKRWGIELKTSGCKKAKNLKIFHLTKRISLETSWIKFHWKTRL